jgi:hypoxanthine phosphoribosyltransferase
LKEPGHPNIPIQAIGLSLYEELGGDGPIEAPGTKVTRTQWIDLSSLEMKSLIGKNILIVDEVDDTRTTLEYAVRDLEKDIAAASEQQHRESEKTTFSIFVLHVSRKLPNLPLLLHPSKFQKEQGQAEKGQSSHIHNGYREIFGSSYGGRRLDLLSVGSTASCPPLTHTANTFFSNIRQQNF